MAKGKGKPHKPNDRKEEKSSESSASSSNNGKKEDTSTSNEDAIKGESKQAERGERASQVLTVPNDIKVSGDIVEKVAPSDATISLGKVKRENSPPAIQNRTAQKEKISEKSQESAEVHKEAGAAPPNVEESPFTATVFLAAQVPKNGRLAVTGSDKYLGNWKAPQGTFERVLQIQPDLFIFKCTIPVPSRPGSAFKFVEFGEKIDYEGADHNDDRFDEILPDSWNFFIYKHRSEGWSKKLKNFLFGPNTEVAGKIVVKFMEIAFNRAVEDVTKNWNSGVNFLLAHLQKIGKVKGGNVSDEFRQFLNQRLKQTELAVNFDHLFLLIIGAFNYGIFSKNLHDFIEAKNKEFSLYLHRFNKTSPATKQLFMDVLEQIAINGGTNFWWILFRINRLPSERWRKVEPKEISTALMETVFSIPEVLLSDNACTSRLLDFLLKHNDLDWIASRLFHALENDPPCWTTVENFLIAKVLAYKSSMDDLVIVLKSDFVKTFYERTHQSVSNGAPPSQQEGNFKRFIFQIYNKKNLLDTMQLACNTPHYLLPIVVPIVEDLAAQKSGSLSTLSLRDYQNFAFLDDSQLKNFPVAKQRIDASILKMTDGIVKSGNLNDIRNIKLLLLGLTRKEDLSLLSRSSCIDLQKAISKVPTKFFQYLHSILNSNSNKIMKQHRKGETKNIVERLENHFDIVSELINKVNTRDIPVIEVGSLMDPQVLSYLKHAGLDESSISAFRRDVEQLRTHHKLYAGIFSKFSQLNIVAEAEEEIEEDQTVDVLDTSGWESYLKEIHPDRSILKLRSALEAIKPLEIKEAKWLDQIKDCPLLMEKIWHHLVVSERECVPLVKQNLLDFVNRCAFRWMQLAIDVAGGLVPFEEMQKIVELQPDARYLSQFHLNRQNRALTNVMDSYRDFKSLSEIRLLISPFVAALRLFSIEERTPIDELYNFVNEKLVNNWHRTTLAQVRSMGIIETLKVDLKIDSERPESRKPMEFISSLVTDENGGSPLIDWLRNKKEKDMEAMGKILQGTLLEAYGQLQTLKTRISPFLNKQFRTYQDLLRAVRESEQRFSERLSHRVQPIKCKWLVNMLIEIEAAIRASIISPSEDAKTKLTKLDFVIINSVADGYAIEIKLSSGSSSLSLEELQQAYQLLDMSITDDIDSTGDSASLVATARANVALITRLSDVFGSLFASGCITYAFQDQKRIELNNLEDEIENMELQLDKWTSLWKDVDEFPHLALFSRSYLLHLADLVRHDRTQEIIAIFRMLLPSASKKLEKSIAALVKKASRVADDDGSWLSTDDLFDILRQLQDILEIVFYEIGPELSLPPFLKSYSLTLRSHFMTQTVVILNVPRELLVGSSLAAYVAFTGRPIEPSRILFVTGNTDKEEVGRFMKLWSVADKNDFFVIVHIERLSSAGANAIRDGVGMVLPERRAKLLLLAQHHNRLSATKSLGARLGLVSDRLLEINFTSEQLGEFFSTALPNAANMHFYTSKLPGCGKSQQVLHRAAAGHRPPDYYRIPVRLGSVEELLASLKKVENLSGSDRKQAAFLHFDVAHSTSLEFNDILLSLLIHGALYDPKKAKLGFWTISRKTSIAIEFASPFGVKEFPIISYIGEHRVFECLSECLSYDLAVMPRVMGQKVTTEPNYDVIAASKFLQVKESLVEGLDQWDVLCDQPESIMMHPLPKELAFQLLVDAFRLAENRKLPTFTALNAMASFLRRHIRAMMGSMWFNTSATFLFDSDQLAKVFKLNIFNMLLKVADDCVSRSWSVVSKKQTETDWSQRQRAMFLLGLNEDGQVMGMNIVGRDKQALKNMFHPTLLPILELQCLQFQELRGFKNLISSPEGAQVVLNAVRSLFMLDGTVTSAVKVYQMDSYPRNTPAIQILRELTGKDLGYVLTGDNITKMMFALYRIRCGLPVIIFGEAGVGKSALFRFLIQSLLGHDFEVCNVNSGTTIQDIETMIDKAMATIARNEESQVFLFFDEMNTADPPVIAFLKELMLDRHCHGTVLPENVHLMAAANPYRHLLESDKEAAVGLAFRFAQSAHGPPQSDTRNLVYRVNELPLSFYDHVYDFGHLCEEAEDTYIEEICQFTLSKCTAGVIKAFVSIIQKSHRVARAMSPDTASAVSLRDATRAAQLFHWFLDTPAGRQMALTNQIAADLTIFLVYAFRFQKRKLFLVNVFGEKETASKNMKEVSKNIAKKLYDQAHGASIGSGAIALNDALCENLFALYVCVLNGIFLIIVGRPGSSKSLSVEILKLVLSPGNHGLRQRLGDLPALTELYFQCSPLSTSSGFKALFESAAKLSIDPKTMLAMVVLDELGLADLSPEKPIKVLHSELERKAVLTSGEQQLSPYSVVALSNWVVDAAQVNRGILILRKQAGKEDLIASAKELAHSLIANKYSLNAAGTEAIERRLTDYLKSIVDTYQELDRKEDIGGGHFFSMRDFFYCVKSFVCSVFESAQQGTLDHRNLRITDDFLVRSTVRNLGGHEQAQKIVRKCLADCLETDEDAITIASPLDLIVQNIQDSEKEMSVHIARHLMILNRSMIGLQLLNRHVRDRLDKGLGWNVLFGSCFPGDLQVMAVTRKLRQVEQAIRGGGVLILCHADQLFESLYMVLNQQYWAQGDVTMTQIALGPSIRAIALPTGPFRIIALQDTDVALNRDVMSPAILSRFEKHELKPSHLLDKAGRTWLNDIESHPIWIAVSDVVKRKKLLCGYHEESFASLALHLQTSGEPMLVDEEPVEDVNAIWMRALNPMAMIKLERDSRHNPEVLELCQLYRRDYILEGIDDALANVNSNRLIIMTSSLRHLEVLPCDATPDSHLLIRLFDIQTELELNTLLESVQAKHTKDKHFCLVVQYDATTGPIEQLQLTKYEIDTRLREAECQVIFIVHVDPRPVGMHWIFSFGDGWEYAFVDEIVPVAQMGDHDRISLGEFVHSSPDTQISEFIRPMPNDWFKSLLLEMLGPCLQASLSNLRSSLGPFYSGVRTALGLPGNDRLIQLLKDCLLAQLDSNNILWNIVDAVSDPNFDSSSSLTEGLWGIFKNKVSNSLAHLLLVSDVWRVSNETTMSLWCDFVETNFPEKVLFHSTDALVQMPVGFRFCHQPFGRLLTSFDKQYAQNPDSRLNKPLRWLLDRINQLEENGLVVQEAYFRDWLLLRIPPHLHACIEQLPMSRMKDILNTLFEDPECFFEDWESHESDVIAALELLSIASFATSKTVTWPVSTATQIRNWKVFNESAARLSLNALATPDVSPKTLLQSITSIEVSSSLHNLLERVEDLSQLWLGLRINKRMLLFNPGYNVKLPELQGSSADQLMQSLTELVIESVIRPRVAVAETASRRAVRQADLNALLKSTSTCDSPKELAKILRQCPETGSLILMDENASRDGKCSSCGQPLVLKVTVDPAATAARTNAEENGIVDEETAVMVEAPSLLRATRVKHLKEPDARSVESLFQDHQKFLFFFERVADLYIQQRRNNSEDIRVFLRYLINDTRFRVSWRFLTVIVRCILSTVTGTATIDHLLSSLRCNRLSKDLPHNTLSFLRALLVCADEDARLQGDGEEAHLDFIDATMTQEWTLQRIHRLAQIRKQLASKDRDIALSAVEAWGRLRQNEHESGVTEAFIFFILRFTSGEGDQTRLNALLRERVVVDELENQHPIISPYLRILSPFALGFDLLPAGGIAPQFDELLNTGNPFTGIFMHYPMLFEQAQEWAPFIARLAFHATDVSANANIGILSGLATDLAIAAQCFLPGIDNHPYLASFNAEAPRWFICTCGQANCVGNCGNPTAESICVQCSVPLTHAYPNPRQGVRRATIQDFQPPRGWHTQRDPSTTATFTVREKNPVVTRFALLLNSLTLMNAALNPRTDNNSIVQFMHTLPLTDRNPGGRQDDRRSLVRVLSRHIIVHLDLLIRLLITRQQITTPDMFRIAHLLLHKLRDYRNLSLTAIAQHFTQNVQTREGFEVALTDFLAQQRNVARELDKLAQQSDGASKTFQQALVVNESSYWTYARRVFSDRQSAQLELARNPRLRSEFPFLNLLLDDEKWARKLNALRYLGEAMRFIALVRSVLQGNVTHEEASRMTISQGLDKIIEAVSQKAVLLDRGRPVSSGDQVNQLFRGLKQLWDSFSQLPNLEQKTFLDHFECQQIDINVRPKTVLDEDAPLILILAGNELPETTFVCQLLNHAADAASSVSLTNFIQPHCRFGSGRVRLSCNSAAVLADFDESLYAHVAIEEVDQFISDHVIDKDTLRLAESFAMTAILGSAGSTIAQDIAMETIPEFVFKDNVESSNYLLTLERRSLRWQPTEINPEVKERIITDLERNRCLAEAKEALVCAITHLQANAEPLVISQLRNSFISDVFQELIGVGILTERHLSIGTLSILNRHLKLQVRHVFGLLKGICARMNDDDIFGGRVPPRWGVMMPDRVAQTTLRKMQSQNGDIMDTLLQMANIVSSPGAVPPNLEPDKSLLLAIRLMEGEEWDGLPAELKMENLGHVLLLAESKK